MDTKIRLTRKPMTTVLWVILTAAMALLLSVGAALLYSSGSLAGILDKYHTSIAVRTDRATYAIEEEEGVHWQFEDKALTQSDVDQLMAMDSVEDVYFHSLTGGYCPQLKPRMGFGGLYMIDESYDGAAVIGTITRITEPEYYDEFFDLQRIGGGDNAQMCSIGIEVKVEQFVFGNPDFTKWHLEWFDGYINMNFNGVIAEDLDLLQVGQRYILAGEFDREQRILHDSFEESGHPWLLNHSMDFFRNGTGYGIGAYSTQVADGRYQFDDAQLVGPTIARIDCTLEEFLAKPENADWVRLMEDQQTVQHCFPILGTEALETLHCFVNQDASVVAGRFFTEEEYTGAERVCILSESVAMDAGIGVGDTITMSQYLCHNYGYYETNNSVFTHATDGMLNNPTVGEFQPDTRFGTEDEVFTVVGLYRLRNEWSDGSYAVTPNTIFIPKKAQIEGAFGGLYSETEVERTKLDGTKETYTSHNEGAAYGVYMSVKLKNGMVEDFENEIEGSDFAGQFRTLDQGFGKIQSTLNEISGAAGKLFWLVAAGWLLLLALYALLYQGSQRKNLGIMRSLGASPGVARNYLWGSGMLVAVIGVGIGSALASSMLGVVQDRLFLHSFGMEVSKYSNAVLSQGSIDLMLTQSQLPAWVVLVIAGVQLGLFTLILWLQARRLSSLSPRALLSKT